MAPSSEAEVPGIPFDDQHVALAADFLGHPFAHHVSPDDEVGRVGRGPVADAGEHRHTMLAGTFDGLVQRRRVEAIESSNSRYTDLT